jgi:hypothetical protein
MWENPSSLIAISERRIKVFIDAAEEIMCTALYVNVYIDDGVFT